MAKSFKKRNKEYMEIDAHEIYGSDDRFCLKFYHGGKFVGDDIREYVGGDVDIIDMVEATELSIDMIRKMVVFVGNGAYPKTENIFCYYWVPGSNLMEGLQPLDTDDDVKGLCSHIKSHKCLIVFVEYGVTSSVYPKDCLSFTYCKNSNLVVGSFKEQYGLLPDYCAEIVSTNPGSTMKIEVEPCADPHMDTRVFRRVYCCLGPLKEGFKAGCRPVLGIDGTLIIKRPFPGQLLTAIGIDSNNEPYPLSWALVESENEDSWEWFLQCIKDDLDLTTESHFCFISDKQKGLIPALLEVFPFTEHRCCLKHLWDNFRLSFNGQAYKDLLWSAAYATDIHCFAKAMDELKKLDSKAFEWLSQIPPSRHWSKSHFSSFPRCDILYNNLSETFNTKLHEATDKPIVTCLENIRLYVTKHIATTRKEIGKSHGLLCPKIETILAETKKKAAALRAIWNGGTRFEVSDRSGDQAVVVDLKNKSCSCKIWNLTCIPCEHAVKAIWCNIENGGDGLPENWVDECYKVSTWKKIYEHLIVPIPGVEYWTRQSLAIKLQPPVHNIQPSSSKKARRKSHDQPSPNLNLNLSLNLNLN